jgi:hypothetical protein
MSLSQDETVSGHETQIIARGTALELRLGRWQLSGGDSINKSAGFVRTIAKGFVGRVATAAEANDSASRKPKGCAERIDDFKIAFHLN